MGNYSHTPQSVAMWPRPIKNIATPLSRLWWVMRWKNKDVEACFSHKLDKDCVLPNERTEFLLFSDVFEWRALWLTKEFLFCSSDGAAVFRHSLGRVAGAQTIFHHQWDFIVSNPGISEVYLVQ